MVLRQRIELCPICLKGRYAAITPTEQMVRAAGFEPASARLRGGYNEPLYDARMGREVGHDPTGTDHLSATAFIGRRLSPENSRMVPRLAIEANPTAL